MLSLNHGVYIIEKGYKKTVCPDWKYFHQNKLFFIFTLIIFSEHSYFLRKSQITPERKQRKKYFLTPFALHRNIQTARKTFIYGLFRNLVLSLCNPFWHFFCKSVWHFTIFPKPLPESDSHMHHTHAPSENENFPSAKPSARTSFLSFFPSHFRSSFRHFCHVLCDFYFSFQVPKPPVFAAFSLLQGILLLILFFLFLRQKNLISGESPNVVNLPST